MAVLTSFGVLIAATMVAALIADLLLLPALVLWLLRPFGPEHSVTGTASVHAYSIVGASNASVASAVA
jgi:hypothetical protein